MEIIDAPDTQPQPHWFSPWILLPSVCIVMMWRGGAWWLNPLGYGSYKYHHITHTITVLDGLAVLILLLLGAFVLKAQVASAMKTYLNIVLAYTITAVSLYVPQEIYYVACAAHIVTAILGLYMMIVDKVAPY